jgi:hypothetical protein
MKHLSMGLKLVKPLTRYNEKRKYNIPSGVLVEGRNVIAVKVEEPVAAWYLWREVGFETDNK